MAAENTIVIQAPRERVFEVLSDPDMYGEWVVGADRIRDADSSWPAPGSRLHHATGVGPLTIDDSTEVVDAQSPERLELLAHLGPLGSFQVELLLAETGDGHTHVTMREQPVAGVSSLAGPVGDAVGAFRNRLSLRRLKEIAERSP